MKLKFFLPDFFACFLAFNNNRSEESGWSYQYKTESLCNCSSSFTEPFQCMIHPYLSQKSRSTDRNGFQQYRMVHVDGRVQSCHSETKGTNNALSFGTEFIFAGNAG